LNAINCQAQNAPWRLSISYGRALQQTALNAWLGKPANVQAGQQTLLECARLNHLAMLADFRPAVESG
jgi:fructose-bisphosphate aldolase class I